MSYPNPSKSFGNVTVLCSACRKERRHPGPLHPASVLERERERDLTSDLNLNLSVISKVFIIVSVFFSPYHSAVSKGG